MVTLDSVRDSRFLMRDQFPFYFKELTILGLQDISNSNIITVQIQIKLKLIDFFRNGMQNYNLLILINLCSHNSLKIQVKQLSAIRQMYCHTQYQINQRSIKLPPQQKLDQQTSNLEFGKGLLDAKKTLNRQPSKPFRRAYAPLINIRDRQAQSISSNAEKDLTGSKNSIGNQLRRGDTVEKRRNILNNSLNQLPFSCVGLLVTKFQNQMSAGTAFLIGKRLAITTSRHCYHQVTKEKAQQMHIIFGAHKNRGIKVKVQYFHFQQSQINKNNPFEDYSFLLLQNDVEDQFGCLGLDFEHDVQVNDRVQVLGYPSVFMGKSTKDDKVMVSSRGIILQCTRHLIYYQLTASAGQDGGPVIIKKQGNFYAIGMHLSKSYEDQYPHALYFNQQFRKPFQTFLTRISGKMELNFSRFNLKMLERMHRRQYNSLRILKLRSSLKYLQNDQKMLIFSCIAEKTKLKELDLAQNRLKYYDIDCFPSSLQILNLDRNQLESNFLRDLMQKPFPKLRTLDISYNRLEDTSEIKIYPQNFPSFGFLNLAANNFTWTILKKIGEAKFMNLSALFLNRNPVFNDIYGLDLSQCSFKSLETLELSQTNICPQVIIQLEKTKMQKLSTFYLTKNNFKEDLFRSLNKTTLLDSVMSLNLSKNLFNEKMIQAFISLSFPCLSSLSLNNCNVDQKLLKLLCTAKFFRELRTLQIESNKINAAGLTMMLKATKNLRCLIAKKNQNLHDFDLTPYAHIKIFLQ